MTKSIYSDLHHHVLGMQLALHKKILPSFEWRWTESRKLLFSNFCRWLWWIVWWESLTWALLHPPQRCSFCGKGGQEEGGLGSGGAFWVDDGDPKGRKSLLRAAHSCRVKEVKIPLTHIVLITKKGTVVRHSQKWVEINKEMPSEGDLSASFSVKMKGKGIWGGKNGMGCECSFAHVFQVYFFLQFFGI